MQVKDLSERIKRQRKIKGLTQAKLAELLGISEMTVRRWESKKTSPRMDEIPQISEVLGVTPETLLNGDTEENETAVKPPEEPAPVLPIKRLGQTLIYERNGERMELPPTEESYAIFEKIATMIARRETVNNPATV